MENERRCSVRQLVHHFRSCVLQVTWWKAAGFPGSCSDVQHWVPSASHLRLLGLRQWEDGVFCSLVWPCGNAAHPSLLFQPRAGTPCPGQWTQSSLCCCSSGLARWMCWSSVQLSRNTLQGRKRSICSYNSWERLLHHRKGWSAEGFQALKHVEVISAFVISLIIVQKIHTENIICYVNSVSTGDKLLEISVVV